MERRGGIKFLITLQCQWKKKCEKCARKQPGSCSFLFFPLFFVFFLFFFVCRRRRKYRRLPSFHVSRGLSSSGFPFFALCARVSRKRRRLCRWSSFMPAGQWRANDRHCEPCVQNIRREDNRWLYVRELLRKPWECVREVYLGDLFKYAGRVRSMHVVDIDYLK